MDHLKIYLGGNATLQAAVLECLFALGYKWLGEPNYFEQRNPDAIFASYNGVISIEETVSRSMFEALYGSYRTITTDDLHEMLILQEYVPTEYLDVNDNYKYHKPTRPVFLGPGWIEIPDGADYCFDVGKDLPFVFLKNAEDGLHHTCDGNWQKSKLNSVSEVTGNLVWQRNPEPDPFLKEYLTPDFRLMLASEPQDGWIEVPEGAETATYSDVKHCEQIIFWKKVREKHLGVRDYIFSPNFVDHGWTVGGVNLRWQRYT